jgi:hypothetical protein
MRRKYKGMAPMPNIGYGSNAKTRHTLPSGFLKFVVANVKDLELLMMHNRWGRVCLLLHERFWLGEVNAPLQAFCWEGYSWTDVSWRQAVSQAGYILGSHR